MANNLKKYLDKEVQVVIQPNESKKASEFFKKLNSKNSNFSTIVDDIYLRNFNSRQIYQASWSPHKNLPIVTFDSLMSNQEIVLLTL